jgi:hypothetical protein
MQSGKKIAMAWYVAMDYCMAGLAWLLFYFLRSRMLDDAGAYPITTRSWLLIVLVVPAGWLILYTLAGTYHRLYKKSRLEEDAKPTCAEQKHRFACLLSPSASYTIKLYV